MSISIISAALSWLRLRAVSGLLGSGITSHLAWCCAFCGAIWAVAAVGLWHSFEWGLVINQTFLIYPRLLNK